MAASARTTAPVGSTAADPSGTAAAAYAARAADVTNVIQSVNGVSAMSDVHDWKACRALFADDVWVDYSALTGQPAAVVNADVLMDGWSKFLPGFKRTQHLLGSHIVNLNADATSATCVTALQLTFLLPNDAGGPVYQVWGGFEYALKPTTDLPPATGAAAAAAAAAGKTAPAVAGPRRWRVERVKLLVHHAAGNPAILALAGKIAAEAAAAAAAPK